jgi:hypothetical protein
MYQAYPTSCRAHARSSGSAQVVTRSSVEFRLGQILYLLTVLAVLGGRVRLETLRAVAREFRARGGSVWDVLGNAEHLRTLESALAAQKAPVRSRNAPELPGLAQS